jgi:alpha-D-xyloside xylohydrolase
MEWSPVRFPDPAGFLTKTRGMGVEVNLWQNPYVAPGSNLFKALGDGFGSHTVWLGAVPDLYLPNAASAMREFLSKHHLALGVSGYKIDEVDGFDNWLWPDHAEFPSGPCGLQMRQIYGVLWQRELDRMFHDAGRRTFGLVRASNGGASRFPFAIYSDTYDHRQYVAASINCSLAGVLWCAEIRSADTDAEWVRRMQSACLSPIAQLNAWDSGKKPWSYPKVEREVRDAVELREALVPYLYTAYAGYHRDGIPPVRPMSLVDGGLETDQYLLGPDLLVAPMFAGEKHRKVRLPAGQWYDYATGTYVGSAETIEVSPTLDQIPLYVRGGAAIPTLPAKGNLASISNLAPYQLRAYGPGPWTADLYEDDGATFAYEHGDYGLFRVTVGADASRTGLHAGKRTALSRSLQVLQVGAH